MVIYNILVSFLTNLLDFHGNTSSVYFSTWEYLKILFFSHTHCHSEKKKDILKKPKLFYPMTCELLQASKVVEENIERIKKKKKIGVTIQVAVLLQVPK